MKTKVYPASWPKVGEWVLQWKSANMGAPAFWYYSTEELAKDAEARLQDARRVPQLREVQP